MAVAASCQCPPDKQQPSQCRDNVARPSQQVLLQVDQPLGRCGSRQAQQPVT